MGQDLSEYYIVCGYNRDSHYEDQSNFHVAIKRLGGEHPPDVIVGHFGDWLCGWFKLILVHEKAESAIMVAEQIVEDIKTDMILDWDHYEGLRSEEVDSTLRDVKNDIENDLIKNWSRWGIKPGMDDETMRKIINEHVV